MKPQEVELVAEISKLQCMVSELKTGFTSALLELSQIQHGDAYLREEMEDNRRSCQKKALRLEALVESLREELAVMQFQIMQLYGDRQRPQQVGKSSTSKQREGEPAEAAGEQTQGGCPTAAAACPSRGKLLLHCFLQGLKAGLSEGTDARHQVAMQLLHSEWEYVSTLNQLYDKYKMPGAHQVTVEPQQTYLTYVEQLLQRHLLFRNTLQERLSAEHWKSLVGDILVQLIGQNDRGFSDVYLGYTTSLASLLSLEFDRMNHPKKSHHTQDGQVEKEEIKLLSLLLAPVSRIHSYLSHIQNLLQWTGKDHPDCSLLLGTERALRSILSRCHEILEEDVQWGEKEGDGTGQSCSDVMPGGSSVTCCKQDVEPKAAAQRDNQPAVGLTNGQSSHHQMRLECWSCSPVRRKTHLNRPPCGCGHACCSLLTSEPPGWGDNSDSGQGTFSQPTGRGTNEPEAPHTHHGLENSDSDPDDTSAFDYSSVTSCSPDGTLCREMMDEEEDSQVPVLLKPSSSQQRQTETPREKTVCLRWQIPRQTPHPPVRSPAGRLEGPMPCLVSSYGKRLVSVRKGSPPLHPKSAFRPIWDDPSKQVDSAPERDNRPGFVPIQTPARQSFQNFNLLRENLRSGLFQQRENHVAAVSSGGLWEDSEDSEGPCSTV
ncbi:uncharacterized protein si:ch211-67f24.7 isoform X2 [Antennarius striatus]|uniref:uncharacterized protein si:ch211-67f24.7 isoform X2 n=2 Tax=Antennarius striatus TaxID=241820 RepID=UPI0035B2D564